MRAGRFIGLALLALGGMNQLCAAQGLTSSKLPVNSAINQLQTEQLPDTFRMKMLVWIGAISFMSSLAAFLTRRFDWQHRRSDQTCSHCRNLHVRTGSIALMADTAATAAFFYLIALPFAAALREEGLGLLALATTILMFLALALLITAAGTVLGMMNLNPNRSRDSFLVGLRLVGFTAGAVVLLGGFTTEAVASNLSGLLGSALGERLLSDIGAEPVRETAFVLTGGIAASVLLRWVIPFLLGSRPLALVRSGAPLHRGLQGAKA